MDNARPAASKRLEAGALLLAAAVFFTVTCAIAQTRLLWYDELFTRQIAQLGSWQRIVAALHHGIDLQPPIFYFLTARTTPIGGEEIGPRLPAILGFTFAGLSLYLIARRWFSVGYATAVALTPSILYFGALAMEARPYGLVIGCAALALLGWTYRDRWPLAGRIGYIAGILGAASAHYYGFTIAVPFGSAVAWTLWNKRRWDLWTLLGCACAIVPNLWNFQLIREAVAIYRNGAWNTPRWGALLDSMYGWCLVVLAAAFLVYLISQPGTDSSPGGESLVCWTGFSAIPILAMFIARATSGLFTLRYYSMFILGFALLLGYLVEAMAKGSRLVGYVVGCGTLLAFAYLASIQERQFEAARDHMSSSCGEFTTLLMQPEYRESRLLIGDPHFALQLAQYCGDLRNRIVFGADPDLSLLYHGNNTDNKGMLHLRENPPIRIEPLNQILQGERHELVVFHSGGSFLKEYFSHEQEYAGRLHLLENGETFALYRLDPSEP